MLTRKKPLNRKTPLRANQWGIPRKKRIRGRALEKRSDDAQYSRDRAEYLSARPYCEIFMAIHRLSYEELHRQIPQESWGYSAMVNLRDESRVFMPLAHEVHHRNRRHTRKRLLDKRFWLAASRKCHDWATNHADEARSIGVTCKIQTDEDGYLPDGSRYLFTADLLEVRARGGNEVSQ